MELRRGLTLSELLIAVSLTGLVTLWLGSQLIHIARHTRRLQERDSRHKAVQLVLQRMSQDLLKANPQSISLRANPSILGVQCWKQLQDDGTLLWEPEIQIYFGEDTALWRRSWSAPDPASQLADETTPQFLPAPWLQDNARQAGRCQRLARELLLFEVRPQSRDQGLQLPLVIRVRLGPAEKINEQAEGEKWISLR